MNARDSWSMGTRLLLVLGVGLLLVGAWIGGRMSAGGGAPFGVMDSGRHGEGMMHGSQMQSDRAVIGEGAMPEDERRGAEAFAGEPGLERCRAMMGTMAGMHRSMQSMMEGHSGDERRTRSSGRRDRMGRGMMGGRRGENMGPMHERMGAMRNDMSPERMRRLCRTMHEAMQAAMQEEDPDAPGAASVDDPSLDPETAQWVQGVRGFEEVTDRTSEDEIVVEVGAGDGLQYAPAAVRVDPGTTVRWRWTGRGGLHDVAFTNADVRTSLRGEEGATFAHTFDSPGAYRYECTPHAGVGMRGAIIVEGEG